jgi:alanyl aminopeptidase
MRALPIVLALLAMAVLAACGPSETKAPEPKPGAGAETDADLPLGQLGMQVVPTRYDLMLDIDPSKERYAGTVKIDVTLKEGRRTIYLHGKDLTVTDVKAELVDGTFVAGTYTQAHETGVARLTFEKELPPGGAALRLAFNAAFNDKPNGLTRQFDSGEPYAWTQFEAISARRAFPCFDEPSFKTPFDITIAARSGDAVISNTLGVEAGGNGRKTVKFPTTAPLPTYLIEIAVGPYDVVDGPPLRPTKLRDHALALRGVTVKGKGGQIRYGLANTEAMVAWLEDYFGRPFPYPKLDLITPPNFSAGGMENAGAITYAERVMLLDENSPLQQRRAYFEIHAHEIAHQWFGDLVTPKWWNDIWLNESFATWMATKTTTALFPQGEYSRQNLRDAMEVMDLDALASARAVRQEIKDTGDIYNAFDGLTYDKGGGVLSMFESYLGEEKFREGVRRHIDRFAGGTADVHDFMESLSQGSGRPEIVPAFESFLNQPGVPLVRMRTACENGKTTIELSQTPYGGADKDARTWQIPVCIRDLAGKSQMCMMLDKPAAKFALVTRCSRGWLPNARGAGYYRFALDPGEWQALLAAIAALTPAEQIATLHSLRAAFRAGETDGSSYAAALERFAAIGLWDVVELAGKFMAEMRGNLLDEKATAAYRTKLRALLAPRMAKVGLTPRPREPAAATLLRASLAELMTKEAQDPATVSALASKGLAHATPYASAAPSAPAALPPELRASAMWALVNSGGAQAARDIVAAIKASSDQQFRTDAAIALTGAREPEAIKEAETFIASGALRLREGRSYYRALFADPDRREAAMRWLTSNFKTLSAPIPPEGRARLIGYGDKLCSREARQTVEGFFRPRLAELTGAQRILANTLEAIDRCVAWRAAKAAEVISYYTAK